jgi:hypothetical protein
MNMNQAASDDAYSRTVAALAALAGTNHRQAPEDSFTLAPEHMHPASPASWPSALTHRYDEGYQDLMVMVRAFGAQAKRAYRPGTHKGGVNALAEKHGVSTFTMRAVLAQV